MCGHWDVVKNGIQKGRQRFKCFGCGHTFQNKQRHTARNKRMARTYVNKRQTLKDIGDQYGKGTRWAQRHIATALNDLAQRTDTRINIPRTIVTVADCTFFSRSDGILFFKDPHRKECVYTKEVISESPRHYKEAREYLQSQGITIIGIVLDGRKGVREVFSDIPVQMCHFHQIAIIKRYLTSRPKLEAGKELRFLTHTLTTTTEFLFQNGLALWYERHGVFINEKTQTGSITKKGKIRWEYTHRSVRSAYHSLLHNLPFLFTYKNHPELSLPNTTNTLDGFFSHLKHLLLTHRGITKEKRWKMIQLLLKTKR